tara:strand:- start:41 stop:553 length:513 start_codon:yes stop_codon:yes gene_type:complete
MTFMNVLINNGDLDDRVKIRNSLNSLGLIETINEVIRIGPQEELKDDTVRMSQIESSMLDEENRVADPFGRKVSVSVHAHAPHITKLTSYLSIQIAPHLGVMAGPGFFVQFAEKKGGFLSNVGKKKEIEVVEYWFGLSDDSVQWYKYKEGTFTSQKPEGKIKLIDIIDIR